MFRAGPAPRVPSGGRHFDVPREQGKGKNPNAYESHFGGEKRERERRRLFGAVQNLLESLILAQDERWRRA